MKLHREDIPVWPSSSLSLALVLCSPHLHFPHLDRLPGCPLPKQTPRQVHLAQRLPVSAPTGHPDVLPDPASPGTVWV